MNLECKEALYGGAAGGGKSDALLADALKYAHVPGYAALLFRKSYSDLALPDAIMSRAHEWLAESGGHWDDKNKTYTFKTSGSKPSTLTFGYLDGPRDRFRYQGAMVQYIGFDELTQFPERDYRYLFSRCRRTQDVNVPLRVRGATNPGDQGHEWVGARFGIEDGYDPDKTHTGPSGRMFVPARLEDNPALDPDYEEMLKELDDVTYQQLRHGRWIVDAAELVYAYTSQCLVSELPKLPRGEAWTHVFAADFGVTNATAFAVWAFNEHDPIAYLVESQEWTGLAPSEAGEIQREWEKRFGGFDRVIGDEGGLGKGFAQEWRKRFYIPIEPAEKTNKLGFIKLMNGDFQHGKIKVLRDMNDDFVAHIKKLRWKDEKRQAEHPGLPNHLTDAALYGWRECRQWDWSERPPKHAQGTAEWQQYREEQRMARMTEEFEREQDEMDQGSNEWIRSDG